METKDFKKTKGIALVITIVVLLILAGVTIATLTGNNGILGQVQKTQESTKIGKFRDQAQLAYMEVYATNAQNGVYTVGIGELISKLQEPQYGYTFQPVPTGSISGITVKQNGVVVNTTNAATVEKADETPAETTATLTVTPTAGEGVDYYIVEDGMYYKISLSGAEITIGEGQETAGNTGGGSPTLRIENEESLQKLETEVEGLTITVVGRTAGEETLEVSYGGQTASVKVTVIETFAVNFYTSSTATEATQVKVASGGNALSVAGYTAARTAADNASPTGEVFDKWVLKTAVGANAVGSNVAELLGTVTQNLNVYATYKELPIAFRNYGEARNPGTYGNSYSVGAVTVNGVTIADNWKKFYEDDNFIYIIYGDYYPALAQTAIPTGNAIFAPARTSSSSYQTESTRQYSVNSGADRATLLGYLKNHSGYSWNTSIPYGDQYGSGTGYQSWNGLQEALSGLNSMSGKTITVQGAPDIELWVESWNAKYGSSTKLKAKKESNGYNIMGDKATSNSNYYIRVTESPYNGANNETNGTGYYDRMYFPNRGTASTTQEPNGDKAIGYWMASPGGIFNYEMNRVLYSGFVGGREDYYYSVLSARPVVAISKIWNLK